MNKRELVDQIARRQDMDSALVAQVIDGFIEAVTRSVARGEKVVLSRFGTFHRQARGRRTARDIWANQPVVVPARNVPAFRPGKPFKEAVARRRRGRAGQPMRAGRRSS
jgi:DNA-binding protein HU-beta